MHSLRWQFVCWISLAILVAGGIFYAILRDGFYREFLSEIDTELQADTESIFRLLQNYNGNLENLKKQADIYHSAKPKGWHVVIRNDKRDLLYGSPNLPVEISELHNIALNKPLTVHEFRIYKIASNHMPSKDYTVRLAFSLQEVQEHLSRLDRSVISMGLIVLVIGPLLAYTVATWALTPLENLTEQVENIPSNPENVRLMVPSTGNELDRLAQVVNQLLSRISQHVRENRNMLADASHQLRTPLAAIRSSVEVVINGAHHDEIYTDLLIQVIDETESLEVLVNQLLLLAESEIPSRSLTREVVAIDKLVEQALEVFEPVAESQGIQFVANLEPTLVMGQRHHLRQMINNLLENAIKFTGVKDNEQLKVIEVTLQSEPNQEQLRLCIQDSGLGMDSTDMPYIFDRFYRANRARTREAGTPGNGLGLSIVKAVAETHGGTVTVESQMGQGTAFVICLPMVKKEATVL